VADEGGEDVVPNAGKTGVEAIVQLGKGDGVAGIAAREKSAEKCLLVRLQRVPLGLGFFRWKTYSLL